MPTYEFRNNNTGKIEEYLLSFSKVDKFKEDNPHLERVWTDTPSVIYKGSGFYSTDYKQTPKTKTSNKKEVDKSNDKSSEKKPSKENNSQKQSN
jgi:predicted nucleic acid-binding Zn ribbon protein|tara:strand:+ start:2953 stop:3234 length:282 start_codon:yes stop_codon:yes gene_type:complete